MQPLLQVTSHIAGKNAVVSVYPDRVEWERRPSPAAVWTAVIVALFTIGISLIFWRPWSDRGSEVIPMRSVSSVTTRRSTMVNDVVSIITGGNSIDLRCSRSEGEALRQCILAQINA